MGLTESRCTTPEVQWVEHQLEPEPGVEALQSALGRDLYVMKYAVLVRLYCGTCVRDVDARKGSLELVHTEVLEWGGGGQAATVG